MSLSLPYFRNRRYLNGIDWLIGAMAYSGARDNNGIGSCSQAVIDVDGVLSEQSLRDSLRQISNRFPLLHGHVARDWMNLAPYWKVSKRFLNSEIPLRVVELPAEKAGDAEQLLAEHVNAPFGSEQRHLRFLLLRIAGERSRLAMVFDHRLFDAFGAELFFRLIDQTWQGRLDEISPRVEQTEPAHLDHWMRRFKSGQTLNRLLIRLNEKETCGMGMPQLGPFRPFRFLHDHLTKEESAQFNKKAGEEIGVPIILPSATARAVLAMQRVFPSMPLPGGQYLVFTTANMCAPGQEWESFLFNHFSLMPFAIDFPAPASSQEAAIALRDQFFERMKENVPFIMQDAAALGRICPHRIGTRLLRLVARGRMCSFYFACLKEVGFSSETFMGLPAVNLVHKPLVFSPPGLNICMTQFHGCYNLVVSYLDGVIDDASAGKLLREFKSLLVS